MHWGAQGGGTFHSRATPFRTLSRLCKDVLVCTLFLLRCSGLFFGVPSYPGVRCPLCFGGSVTLTVFVTECVGLDLQALSKPLPYGEVALREWVQGPETDENPVVLCHSQGLPASLAR